MAFAPTMLLPLDGLSKFFSVSYNHLVNYAVFTFAELGVADRLVDAVLDRGLTAQEIIGDDRSEWNSDLLYRVLRSCTDAGIVKRIDNGIDDKHFVLTQLGMMLTSDHPSHARDLIRWTLGPVRNSILDQLPSLVRGEVTGTGIARISGGFDLYTLISQPGKEDLLTIFNGSMAAMSLYSGTKLAVGVDFGRFATLVDVGGNSGTFLAEILQNHPTIQKGFVFDLPQVIDRVNKGKDFESRMISKERYTFVAGDMFDSSTIPQANAYVLKSILHNYNDEKVVTILSSIGKANPSRTRSSMTIFIVESVILSNEAVNNWQSHAMDLAMAVLFDNARERTQQEYQQLLEEAGFEFKHLYPIQTPYSIIEAVLA